MGREVVAKVREGYLGAELAAEADANGTPINEITANGDAIIDFSHHTATAELTAYAVSRGLPVVIATTGQTEDELAIIAEAAKKIPIFMSANMSVGVALLLNLAKQAASTFPAADIEIMEIHHNRKEDAPSGTALMIADGIREVRVDAVYKLGRSGHAKREPNEIGIHALRMGDVVGEHHIYIDNGAESITLIHKATARSLFADGAIAASDFITGKPAGMYGMENLLCK
jgi:4-hydroxy-tetrahydrodipicolinate reductase